VEVHKHKRKLQIKQDKSPEKNNRAEASSPIKNKFVWVFQPSLVDLNSTSPPPQVDSPGTSVNINRRKLAAGQGEKE
jgi:hypothetical protein